MPSTKHLDKVVRRAGGVTETVKRGHLAALPYADMPAFMARLRQGERRRGKGAGISRADSDAQRRNPRREKERDRPRQSDVDAASRTSEERQSRAAAVHHPLSARAVEILKALPVTTSPYVFPGRFDSQPPSPMTFFVLLRSMGFGHVTAHGFRSTFRDYAGDQTSFPREVCEAALGHVIGGVEAAYRRGSALEKRRELMSMWAAYCSSAPPSDEADNVVRFAARAS